MTEPVSLLPSNATKWETAHELTDAARWLDIDPAEIIRTKDPMLCDPKWLPLLGWERSVDLWFEDWPDDFRRYVIENWYLFEALKGTPAGIRTFLHLAGIDVVRMTRPRQFVWSGRGMSDADYATWLSRLPQIRVYPNHPVSLRPLATASFGTYKSRRCFFNGRSFLVRGLPAGTHERIATLWDAGTETQLYWRQVEDRSTKGAATVYEQVVLPSKSKHRPPFFGRSALGKAFMVRWRIEERTVSVGRPVDVSQPQYFATRRAVLPNTGLVSIVPERIAAPGPAAPLAAIADSRKAFGRCAFRRSNSWRYTYDRYYVDDPARWAGLSSGRPRKFFNGKARFGIAPFTAEVTVDLSVCRPPRRMGRYYGAAFPPVGQPRLERARTAVSVAKSARDRVMIKTQTRRPPTVDDGLPLGTFRLGDTVPA